MNDELYDEIIEENEELERKKFKLSKYKKRKHLLKEKFNHLLNEYFNQFGKYVNKVENFSIQKVKLKIELDIYDPNTKINDIEFLEIIGWKTPIFYLKEGKFFGFYHSFKKAKDSYNPKFQRSNQDDFFYKKIQEKLKKSYPELSSLGICYQIRIKKEEFIKERKISFIKKQYISESKDLLDVETKETENKTFFKQNLKKTQRGFIGKNLFIAGPYKKDSWWTYPTKKELINKIHKKEFLKELKFPF
jgi:hypothetical protein